MKSFYFFRRLMFRLNYPFSMPEDIARDLGLEIPEFLKFNDFIKCLTHPELCPKKLFKFMPRAKAEETFKKALRKEKFTQNSLFSYQFKGGWMEFMLQFDEQSRLRRIYIHHKDLKQKHELYIRPIA